MEVSIQSKGKSPNSVKDTKHNRTIATFDGVFHMDVAITNTQEGIARKALNGVVPASVMVIITSLWERLCLMSGEASHAGRTMLTTYKTHFHKHMY